MKGKSGSAVIYYKDQMKPKHVFDIVGWYGALAVLISYGLVSFRLIPSTGWTFQVLNFTGGIGLLLIAWKKQVWQAVFLNAVWCLVAFGAMIQLIG